MPDSQYVSLSATKCLREKLIGPTLRNALRTKFYQSFWDGIDTDTINIDNLQVLPILDKQMLRVAGVSAQVRDGLICDEIFTSGTTGPPLISVRGNREQEFISKFFLELFHEFTPMTFIRGLQINNPFHGHHVSVPAPVHFHKIGIYDKGSFEHGIKVLLESHADEGVEPFCTILTGLERTLRAFAHYILNRYENGIRSHLNYVVPYAQYLTARARTLFEKAFNCKIIDRFGMSEVFGGATQSAECGWYHFDPCVIPEVVSPQTNQVIQEGTGVLLLTSLYPFQEAQPLIRYSTGDLVEVTHTKSSRPGHLAIKALGRMRYGVPAQSGEDWLLTPAAIYEAIDSITEITRSPLFRDSVQVEDHYVIGHPKYNVTFADDAGIRRITVNIDIQEPVLSMVSDNIKNQLTQMLVANSNILRESLNQKEASIEVNVCSDFETHFISYAD